MNLGLLEGRAAGGPAGLTPAPAGAAAPAPGTADGGPEPAFRMLMDLFAVRTPERPEPDEDEETVDDLLAGLFACTELTLQNRVVVQPEPTSTTSPLPLAATCEEQAETARPGVRKAASAVEHTAASSAADSSSVSDAMTFGEALLSDESDEQSDAELFKGDQRKAAAAMPVQARIERFDLDRNAAVPEFSTPAARPVTSQSGDAQVPLKAPVRAPASQIMFTPVFTHAAHAIVISRIHAVPSTQESHVPASLPGQTTAQIVQTIQLAWTRHGGEARITLDPEQFGDLSVAMRVDRGQVVARVQAETPQVREWLHANLDTLRAGLAEHHLRLDRIEITALDDMQRESENREAGQHDGQESSSHPRRSRRHRSNHVFEVEA